MDWELQSRFEHIPDHELQGMGYLAHLFQVLDVLAGEKEFTEMRRTVRAALYEGGRRSDESLGQYSLRREAQFSTASKYLDIPSKLKGFMLEEQAGLSKQALQNLRVLTAGNSEYEAVKQALRVIDTEEEAICRGAKGMSYWQGDDVTATERQAQLDEDVSDEEVDILDTDQVQEVFLAIENLDLCEDRALNFLADWQKRKRSWSENKELKNAMKKDRRHFDDPTSRPPRDRAEGGKRRKNIAELKKVTKCANCGEKGHWRAECTQPYRPRYEKEKTGKNAFVYLGSADGQGSHHFLSNFRTSEDNFLCVPPGFAVVDPGAAQDLIGEKAFQLLREKLARVGLKPVILEEKPPSASGIGGNVQPLYTALTPVFLGGHPGLVKLVVLSEDVPQLLSIGLLEHTGAVIDTTTNEINFKGLGTSDNMTKLESGHRALDVVSHEVVFEPPPEVLQEYGLSKGAFVYSDSAAPCACLAAAEPGFNMYQSPHVSLLVWGFGKPPDRVLLEDKPWNMFFKCTSTEMSPLGSCFDVASRESVSRDAVFLQLSSHVQVSSASLMQATATKCQEIQSFSDVDGHVSETLEVCGIKGTEGMTGDREVNAVNHRGFQHQMRRLLRSLPMLRGLIFCLSLLATCHAADHAPGCSEPPSQRAAPGVQPGEVVLPDSEAADHVEGTFFDVTAGNRGISHDHGINSMSSQGGRHHRGGEPIWAMEEMPGLQHPDQLRPLRAKQPSPGSPKVCSQDHPRACCSDEGQGEAQSRELLVSGRAPECIEPALPGADVKPEPGIGSPDPEPSDAAGADGLCDVKLIGNYQPPGSAGALADAIPSSEPGNGPHRGRRGDAAEPQRGWLGTIQLSDKPSLLSRVLSECLPSEVLEELQHDDWMVYPFKVSLCQNSFVQHSDCFLWHPPNEHQVFLVSRAPGFVFDLKYSDVLDDHEFFLTSKQKKSVKKAANNAERTQRPQERAARTQRPQPRSRVAQEQKSFDNNAERTPGPQEGLPPGIIGNKLMGYWEKFNTNFPGHFSPIGLPRALDHAEAMFSREKSWKVCELFSPPRLTAEILASHSRHTTTSPPSFDRKTGWEFNNPEHRRKFWKVLDEQSPDVVGMSPECRPFSILMNSNWSRMDPLEARKIQVEGLAMLSFCVQVAEYQLSKKKYFYIEQPGEASSWNTHSISWLRQQLGVFLIFFDQCMAGLSVKPDTLSRKSTGILCNHGGIVVELSKFQCDGQHEHLHLQGGLPRKAQEYPPELVSALLRGIDGDVNFKSTNLMAEDFGNEGDPPEGDEEEEGRDPDASGVPAPQTPRPVVRRASPPLSPQQKEMLHRLHCNMGHAPRAQLLMMLKAAGAKDSVLKHVQEEFQCDQCMRQHRPVPRKQVTFPRTFSFNHVLAVDFFYISWMGKTHAFLNVICHGTSFQQVGLLKNYLGGSPHSSAAWGLLESLWIRPFGLPNVILSDQGSEFKHVFERKLEQHGIMQIVTDSGSPWQNGRCERHGSWVKQRLEEELQSGQATVESSEELEQLTLNLVACKNRYFHRGGYSPSQLVFGINPRLPSDLLSDDQLQLPALGDLVCDPTDQDSAASEFARSHAIRQRAREMCVKSTLKDRVQLGVRRYAHKERTWTQGQWVYCWRKFSGTGGGHTTRARWMGPGLVIQQQGHTVWVSMRSRVWKCSSDQLRPANYSESLGAELMDSQELSDVLENIKGKRATAVDVASEGPPPLEASDAPIGQDLTLPEGDPRPGLQPIPEEEEEHAPPKPQTPPQRVALPPAPTTPMPAPHVRRESTQTVEEPLMEPIPSTRSQTSAEEREDESKRRRLSSASSLDSAGKVKRRVDQIESARLEREALRYLKQLDREERVEKARRRHAENSLADIAASSERAPSAPQKPPEDLPDETQQHDPDLLAFEIKSHMEDLMERHLPAFHVKPQQQGKEVNLLAKPAKAKNTEFDMKTATAEERLGFRESDASEWEAILSLRAVKVLNQQESKRVLEQHPERVISSRMIRRKKPTPGVGSFKFKSRWCIHGHQDPDTGTFEVFSPTPSTESITMFFQICVNETLLACFLDVKNAFCQAKALDRPRGKLYARPCEGCLCRRTA